jgi:hypothetical protein
LLHFLRPWFELQERRNHKETASLVPRKWEFGFRQQYGINGNKGFCAKIDCAEPLR